MTDETEEVQEEITEEATGSDTESEMFDMTDDEIMNMAAPDTVEPAALEDESSQEGDSTPDEEESVEDTVETTEEAEIDESEGRTEDTATTEAKKEESAPTDTKDEQIKDETGKASDEKEEAAKPVDYKAEYSRLMEPFKANGKEMKVANVDDAITLMKMGANYNKKMAGLKPNLKLLKMLENNDLLDESKLSYLIDLDKKNPDAVSKLVKDSGVNPLDIDVEKEPEYKPNTYTVNDKEVELDQVLDDIRDTPSYKDTINVITNKWDNASQEILVDQPQIIKLINSQVENGIYDRITTIMESERALGRLTGLSDLAAYKQIGDAIQARGGFNEPQQPAAAAVTETAKTEPVKKVIDPRLNDRKKAASSTKSTKKATTKQDFNPLAVSDEEFEKIASSRYM